jgi:cytochrome c oxidase subunit 2
MNWSWMLPAAFSSYAPQIDRMYYIILVITGVVFVITEVLLLAFVFVYRHREGHKAEYIHGNVAAEVIWTAIPFVIVMWIGLASRSVWASIKDPVNIPAGALEVVVTAKQFEWNVTYGGADGVLRNTDDFVVRNRLDVPVNRPIKIYLNSEDVIHSFFLPEMRVKQDAVPGMEIQVWFEALQAGEYTIGCAELCGTGHTRMRGTLVVHEAADYQAWLTSRTTPAAPAGGAPATTAPAPGATAPGAPAAPGAAAPPPQQ